MGFVPGRAGISTLAFARTNPRFCVLLLRVALLYFGHSTACNFLINLTRRVGGSVDDMGIITGFKGLVEIPTMLLYAQLFRSRNHALAIRIAAVAFVLKTIAFIAARSVWNLTAAFILQTPSYGLFMAAIVPYVEDTIDFADTRQGSESRVHDDGGRRMLANLISGQLCDFFSVSVTLCIALAVGMVGAAVVFLGTRGWGRRGCLPWSPRPLRMLTKNGRFRSTFAGAAWGAGTLFRFVPLLGGWLEPYSVWYHF